MSLNLPYYVEDVYICQFIKYNDFILDVLILFNKDNTIHGKQSINLKNKTKYDKVMLMLTFNCNEGSLVIVYKCKDDKYEIFSLQTVLNSVSAVLRNGLESSENQIVIQCSIKFVNYLFVEKLPNVVLSEFNQVKYTITVDDEPIQYLTVEQNSNLDLLIKEFQELVR